jgi:hypothetical protein
LQIWLKIAGMLWMETLLIYVSRPKEFCPRDFEIRNRMTVS